MVMMGKKKERRFELSLCLYHQRDLHHDHHNGIRGIKAIDVPVFFDKSRIYVLKS